MAYFVEGICETADPQMQVRRIGEFETVAAAIAVAQQTVDAFMQRTFKPGMDAKTLLALYHTRAEHPMIFRDDDSTFNVPGFNHIRYAMTRVRELCGD